MMKKHGLLLSIFMGTLLTGYPQPKEQYYQGYNRSIHGGGFQYHAPDPDVSSSILIRSIDSTQFIEWETEIIRPLSGTKEIRLIWMFGIDATNDSHKYRLLLNDKYCLAFSNPIASSKASWTVQGVDGSRLLFRPTMLDKYNDQMGYAILTVPVTWIREGLPQRIRITGESAGSRAWYMTFEAPVQEKMNAFQIDAVVRDQDQNLVPVLFRFIHLGEKKQGSIKLNGRKTKLFTLEPGYNEVTVHIPEVTCTDTMTAMVKITGGASEVIDFVVKPVRHWNIYLVQHTHTDIGYTRPQTEILPEHLRFIDYALDYCDVTDSFPDDSRFRWTCETSWAVREYIRTRPAKQLERLKRRVQEGRIEITGLFLNGSDLSDEAAIAAILQPIRMFRDQGFPVQSAMQDDINGVPWCLADYLPGAGIEFLTMAQNTHRARKPFNIPTVFWWESPSGTRLMVNRSEHYMYGNSLGILTNPETFGRNLFRHLHDISVKGYPFDQYAIQFSGYLTDNSPPSTTACKLVKAWNEIYVWPRLTLATVSSFLKEIKEHHAHEIPVIRGAWPDWWMDGFGSAAIETAYARMAHTDYIANNGLMTMALLMGDTLSPRIHSLHAQVTDDLAFYDEHTFGAAESIWDPLAENSIVQLGQKVSYVWSAVKTNRLLREEVMGRIQPFFPSAQVPSVTVVNTLGRTRSGPVNLYIDHQILPPDRSFRILDASGQEIPAQAWFSREDGTYWTLHIPYVPPFGFRSYRIVVRDWPVTPPAPPPFQGVMENQWYRFTIDPVKGVISGIRDKELGLELTDQSGPYKMGEFIYERLGKNRSQLEQYRLEEYTRTGFEKVEVSDFTNGPVWQSVTITGLIPECATEEGVHCEIRLYHYEKKIEFRYSMKKIPVTDPEGVYIAFPFHLQDSRIWYEVAGGTPEAGVDQIPGSASDWQGIQNFISVRNDSVQIIFVSPEIPLVQLGDINLGRFTHVVPFNHRSFSEGGRLSPFVFSWVLNNYWTTNFLAKQEGELKWSYQITSMKNPSLLEAAMFGWSNRIPMLTRILPASNDSTEFPRNLLGGALQNVMLVNASISDDRKGVILHLREVEGKKALIPIDDPLSSVASLLSGLRKCNGTKAEATEVNVLGENIGAIEKTFEIQPYQTRFVKITIR
jgi:hypothetical protein